MKIFIGGMLRKDPASRFCAREVHTSAEWLAGYGMAAADSYCLGDRDSNYIDRDRDRYKSRGDPETTSSMSGAGRGHGATQRMGGSMGPGGFAPKARGWTDDSDEELRYKLLFFQALLAPLLDNCDLAKSAEHQRLSKPAHAAQVPWEPPTGFTDSERDSEDIPQPRESQVNVATFRQACTLDPETIHGSAPQVPRNPWTNPPSAMSGWNLSFDWGRSQAGAGAPTPGCERPLPR
ncbi:hypothetical protein SLS62_008300 [Diatrype stigma]|uniref:Uncharacterized protein n=1 Tax=Diatrype stigma TaxID=117547 RepID=A0AAN9ULG5_9PEZI